MKLSGPTTDQQAQSEIEARETVTDPVSFPPICRRCGRDLADPAEVGSTSREGKLTCVTCLAKPAETVVGVIPIEDQLTDEERRARGASNLEKAKAQAAAQVAVDRAERARAKGAKADKLSPADKETLALIRDEKAPKKPVEKPTGVISTKGKAVVKKADDKPAASKHPELVQAFLASIEQPKRRANSSSYLKKTLVAVEQGTEADTLWVTIAAERAEQLAKLSSSPSQRIDAGSGQGRSWGQTTGRAAQWSARHWSAAARGRRPRAWPFSARRSAPRCLIAVSSKPGCCSRLRRTSPRARPGLCC